MIAKQIKAAEQVAHNS